MLVDILSQTPTRVYVFGFDFYASNETGRRHGFDGYYVDEIQPEASSYHDSEAEMRFFACLVREGKDPIYIDEHLARTLIHHEPTLAKHLQRVAQPSSNVVLYTAWNSGYKSM